MQGAEEIQQMMAGFRSNPPQTFAGSKAVEVMDYQSSKSKNLITGAETDIDLPKSNVLQFVLEDGSKISARPSGTEPKIKFYISVNTALESVAQYDEIKGALLNKIQQIKTELGL